MGAISRGIAAGAVGTTVLDAVTYTDMALTGRAASAAPGRSVLAVADRVGLDLSPRGSRPEAYGALAGAGTGLAIALVASGLRTVGIRLPLLAEAAVVGVGAMVATDGPMQWADVSDLSTWGAQDWTRDVVPHLAYGLAVAVTLRALEPSAGAVSPAPSRAAAVDTPRRRGLLARSLAIGLATGARSSLGLVPPALGSGRTGALALAAGLVTSELTVDKLPATGSRLDRGPLLGRIGLGAVGAAALARHQSAGAFAPAVMGALGAVAGSFGGWWVRDVAATRGWTWQAAAIEDGVALALTAAAWRGSR